MRVDCDLLFSPINRMYVLAIDETAHRDERHMKLPKTAHPSEELMEATIEEIAPRILRIETLEVQNSKRLDFHERHVTVLKDALRAAYAAGFLDGTVARRG